MNFRNLKKGLEQENSQKMENKKEQRNQQGLFYLFSGIYIFM